MKKILFLIHDLGHGGAEKVLVNLVNNMDHSQFDITVMALFGGGVNEQFLSDKVRYRACFPRSVPGNSHMMKLLSPARLHSWLIKERYDMEVAYLEGPCARIISGCPDPDTKKVCWIHIEQHTKKRGSRSFRSFREAQRCYRRFDRIITVADTVRQDFTSIFDVKRPVEVLYNTNESDRILRQKDEPWNGVSEKGQPIRLVGVGKILPNKGFDRLARIHKRLRTAGLNVHTYILGVGPQQEQLQSFLDENGLGDSFTFLGYQTNPYKYVAKCDLFVCASFAEGFSTAATEALIVGTPVCTVEVSGMKEMLGDNDEYGVVTANDEDALYEGIYRMLTVPGRLQYYKAQARLRGKAFRTEETVRAVEEMLLSL